MFAPLHRAEKRAAYPEKGQAACSLQRDNLFFLDAVDGILQTLAGLECRHLGSLDFDGFAGLGIFTLAGSTLADFEGTEADQGDLVALLEGFGNHAGIGIESSFGILFAQAGFFRNGFDQFGLVRNEVSPLQFIRDKLSAL